MSDNSDWDQFVDLETGALVYPEMEKSDEKQKQKYLEFIIYLGKYVSLRSLGHICLWLAIVIIPSLSI